MKMEKALRSALLLLLAAALCLSMAACTQTPAESSPVSETQTPETAASEKASPEDDMPEDAGTEETPASDALSSALPVKTLRAKRVDENPYMAKSDANIHHDGYNTDSTDEVLPLGIYPEINVSYEKTNANASPAIYFDSYGHAVVPLLGGIAIRDLNAKETTTLGYFSPKQHDGGGYVIQSSYTFLDSENRIVCPTSNNHVLMLRATDEAGNILPEFEKVLDINIKAAAEAALGKTLEQNLLSVVFDYEGNLWFATGGFRIYPEREQQGVLGYIARSAIDAILSGEQTDLSDAVFVYELTPGEGAENGIAASKDGAVILTNMNCYLLRANNGVEAVWCTPYESVGAKVSGEGDKTTGGGLAWGGGCSPSLTTELVMFTDNADPVKLLALDMKTGEIVASLPVLDDLPEGYQVAVENSAIVYDDSEGTVSTIVCNWFGAGNAGLADPNNDSSIQSYANIYDMNWLTKGNCMIAPGVERVDIQRGGIHQRVAAALRFFRRRNRPVKLPLNGLPPQLHHLIEGIGCCQIFVIGIKRGGVGLYKLVDLAADPLIESVKSAAINILAHELLQIGVILTVVCLILHQRTGTYRRSAPLSYWWHRRSYCSGSACPNRSSSARPHNGQIPA